MTKLNVNIGLSVNDKTGDTLRTAFDKINQNFTELYTLTGGTSTALTELAQDYAAPLFNHANHTNITAAYDDANNKILLTGVAAQVQSNWTATTGLGVILNKPTIPIAPTTGNAVISSTDNITISRNGMTIRVTSAGILQMSFDSVINVRGSVRFGGVALGGGVIASPDGVTAIGTWYDIGTMNINTYLEATIVDRSYHRIYKLTAITRDKDTTPGSELATAYAIIEQLQ